MFEFELFALDFEWPDFDFDLPALEFDFDLPDFDFEMGRLCSNYPNSNNVNLTNGNNCYGPCCSKPGGMREEGTPKSDGRQKHGYALRAALWPARG